MPNDDSTANHQDRRDRYLAQTGRSESTRYIERDAAVRAFQRRRRPGPGGPRRPGPGGPQPIDKSKFDARLRELDELLAAERAYSPQREEEDPS